LFQIKIVQKGFFEWNGIFSDKIVEFLNTGSTIDHGVIIDGNVLFWHMRLPVVIIGDIVTG
jgi:hypothetical protein